MITIYKNPATAAPGTPWQAPDKTFFVSPTFSGVSPFFQTVQSAINAANGTDRTVVYIYPGTYAEALTLKNNVFLEGVNKQSCILSRGGTALIVGAPNFTTSFTFGLRNLTIFSTTATTTGVSITPGAGAGAVMHAFFQDVDVLLQFGNSTGMRFDNATFSAINSHELFMERVNLNVNGTNAALYFNKPFNIHTIKDCTFGGSARAILADSISGVFNTVQARGCVFNSPFDINGGSAINWNMDGCILSCTFTGTGGFGNDTVTFRNCVFVTAAGQAFNMTATSTLTFNLYGCVLKASAADANIIELADVDPRFRLYSCKLDNGKISTSVANVKTILVDTQIRNPGGTQCIATTSTPTVFAGNLSADKAIAAAVVLAAGSYNVQTAVAI